MPAQCLIEKVANNFVRFWSDDCPTIETKFDVISSSAPCSCFRVMDIPTCPPLVYSWCTHGVSKTVCQSTMLAHGLNILYSILRVCGLLPTALVMIAGMPWRHSRFSRNWGGIRLSPVPRCRPSLQEHLFNLTDEEWHIRLTKAQPRRRYPVTFHIRRYVLMVRKRIGE